MRTPNAQLRSTDLLEISPDDAERLQLREGECVRVASRYGSVSMPVQITDVVKRGELFATFHDPSVFLNHLTSPQRDRYVKSPEYKVTAVKLEKSQMV
jgi:formate dehydrogenase major subunit